jgi:phytoene/squalene synthetase
MRIAATLLDSVPDAVELTREAGIAYGLAGIMRASPFQAARNRTLLPLDLLTAEGLTIDDAMSVRHIPDIRNVISRLVLAAREHFDRARRIPIPKNMLPAILPASLVPAYLRHVTGRNRDALHNISEVSLFRRQLILLRAGSLGRL